MNRPVFGKSRKTRECRNFTYNVDPSPAFRVVTTIVALRPYYGDGGEDRNNASPKHTENNSTRSLSCSNLETPQPRKELTVCDHTKEKCMGSKSKIVEARGRFRRHRMSKGILRPYCGGKEKCCRRGGIRSEAKNVAHWKIDGKALSRTPSEIENWLGVEGNGPAKEA